MTVQWSPGFLSPLDSQLSGSPLDSHSFPGSSAGKESACSAGDPGSWFLGQEEIPWRRDRLPTPVFLGFPGGSAGKESTSNVGDLGSIPGLGRSPREGNGNPLQYSCPPTKKREAKSKGEKERYKCLNAEFQRIARRDKKAFLNDQCKEIEENNKMGKTRDIFKKIRDTRGIFHARWAQ